MDPLLAARLQMAFSLGFHMLFAAAGMALPLMMVLAEGIWMVTGNEDARRLARTWTRGTAVLFALGAVSGTALSFELGLLWPRLMAFAGPVMGPAFALEGYAFFIEAIFLGLYLYGWGRLATHLHWLSGWAVVVGGISSGLIVVAAVSWMQRPLGYTVGANGLVQDVVPLLAIFNPAFGLMTIHSALSTLQAIGFALAGGYALALLLNRRPERNRYNRIAVTLAMAVALVPALAQIVTGDFLAQRLYTAQPPKLAAMEGQFQTERCAPLRILGWPVPADQQTYFAIEIPCGLSFLAARDPNAEVQGLSAFPLDQWPPTQIVHPAFQIMVASGFAMVGLAAWFWWAWWRDRRGVRDWTTRRWLLVALALATPLGFLSLESGWTVTETGRQPWVVYQVLRTQDAVTPIPSIWASLTGFILLYGGLSIALVLLLRRIAADEGSDRPEDEDSYDAYG